MRRRQLMVLGAVWWAAWRAVPARAAGEVEERVLGRDDAPVAVIEYFSFTCPACALFHRETFPELERRYIATGKVRWILRDFPLDRHALFAALIAHCAGPARYRAFLDVFLENQRRWASSSNPLEALRSLAQLGGLSAEEVDACLTDGAMIDAVLRMRLEAEQRYGVTATPTFLIGGNTLVGAVDLETFAARIEAALAEAGAR